MQKKRISPEVLAKVKEAVELIEVIGEHVVLRKAGREYVGLCPFHNERSGSFYVNADKQVYHCHGCQAAGDVVRFVQEIHGVSFIEAVQELADRARIKLPSELLREVEGMNPEEAKVREARLEKISLASRLNRFVAEFYFQKLKQTPLAMSYLTRRGLTADWIRHFYVGYATKEWDSLSRFLTEKKAPMALAEELGLIRKSTRQDPRPGESGYFDLFRNRVMFPILDTRGRVVGFGGRTLPGGDDAADPKSPKYLNSSDSLLFKKSRIAYGLFQAQKHIREKDEVVFVEGYFDVTALHSAGFAHAVATCGTALTPEHVDLVKRFGKKFILLFDADKAGEAATLRAMELGLELGMVFHGAKMPSGLDPDEVLFDPSTGSLRTNGKEEMEGILKRATPLLDLLMDEKLALAGGGSNEDRVASLKQVAGWLRKFSDPIGRSVRVEILRDRYQVSADLLRQLGLPVAGARSASETQPSPSTRPPQKPWVSREEFMESLAKSRSVTARGPGSSGPVRAPVIRAGQLTDREKSLLLGLARGEPFAGILSQARQEMPAGLTLADFFDYQPARQWVSRLSNEPGFLERLRNAPASLIEPDLDRQVLSTLTEAWVTRQGQGDAQEGVPSTEEFRLTVRRSLARIWARFSHGVKLALADAEAKNDAGLAAKLMKDYLDGQRKLKEFSNFYDEA